MPVAAERWRPSFSERMEQSAADKKLKGRRKLSLVKSPPVAPVRTHQLQVAAHLTQRFMGHPNNREVRAQIMDAGMHEFNSRLAPGEHLVSITQEMDRNGAITMRAQTRAMNAQIWNSWADQRVTHVDDWYVPTSVTINYTCDAWTTGASATNVLLWREWVDTHDGRTPRMGVPTGFSEARRNPVTIGESEEQKKVRAEQEVKWRAEEAARQLRYQEEERKRVVAKGTAMKLLISCLDPQQQHDLKNNKFFYVEAPSGRLYRIDHGTSGNVKVIDKRTKQWVESLCIHPDGVPEGDTMLVQKMMIETAEEVFRAHANITYKDGRLDRAKPGLLTGELAAVIPITRKAA